MDTSNLNREAYLKHIKAFLASLSEVTHKFNCVEYNTFEGMRRLYERGFIEVISNDSLHNDLDWLITMHIKYK